jgi:signal transduction histidine kinase/ActR/RegA family two-component response regulator
MSLPLKRSRSSISGRATGKNLPALVHSVAKKPRNPRDRGARILFRVKDAPGSLLGHAGASDAAVSPQVQEPPDVAPEIGTRAVSTCFRYFERTFGRERLMRALGRIGGEPTLEYLLDPENFVSLEYVLRAARVLTEEAGDASFLRRAGEHQLDDPRILGFVYYVARSLGSPGLYYRFAVKTARSFNRVGEMSIEDLTNQQVRVRYRSLKPEGTRLLCEGRMGQLASAPRLWGQPLARVTETECQQLGAPACCYELTWVPTSRPLVRGLLGGAAGLTMGGLTMGLPGAIVGGTMGTLVALTTAYRAAALANARQILDGAEGSGRSMHELQRRFEEIQKLHVEATATHQSLAEEIAQRGRAEAALIEAQKLEAVGRLSGGIAHDFNNVLTVILGSVEVAKRHLGSPTEVAVDLETIEESAIRAADLTRRLLTFARREIVQPRVLGMREQLMQLDRMLRRMVGEDVQIVFEIGSDPLNVVIDPTQLEQLLMNLAANARDAMPSGGTLRFEARGWSGSPAASESDEVLHAGEYVVLTVSDTGCGMDAATQQRAFEPFFTTKDVGNGTGLGLATCHGIVRQAGGVITIESVPGRGTAVRIHLPRVRQSPEPPATPRSALAPSGTETILVVEDDPHVRQIVARTLTSAGYRVVEAGSGADGVAAAQAEPGEVHLLVTDVVMAGMDGSALAKRIGAIRPNTRTLFVSGYSNEVVSHRGVLAQGVQLLAKPFTEADLLAKVRYVLDQGEPA